MPTGKPEKTKRCKICDEEFLPKVPSQILCSKDHYQPCPICGKLILWNHTYEVPACSKECKNIRRKRKCLEKYGVEHPMQSKEVQRHHKDSMLRIYGVESPLQSKEIRERTMKTNRERFGANWILGSKEKKVEFQQTMKERYGGETTLQSSVLREKVESTNLKKYGVKNVMQNREVQEKAKATLEERYGVDNPMKSKTLLQKAMNTRIDRYGSIWSDSIKQKAIQTWKKNYGVDNPFKSEEIKQKIHDTRTKKYGESWYIPGYRNKVSKINIEFAEYCRSIGISVEYERYIQGKSYDIDLNDRNIVIEIDPSYTHSYKKTHWGTSVNKDYNLSKTLIAKENGLRCIHIWDWDNSYKIANMLVPIRNRIYARACKLLILYQDVAQDFLEKYCIYEVDKNKKLYLGLVYEGELLQVMSFKEYTADDTYEYELQNLCTKFGYQVIGGASKLFHFATNEYEMNNIIAFCDISKFDGEVFEKIGMKKIDYIEPVKYWSLNEIYIPDSEIDKKFITNTFNVEINKNQEVEEIMMNSPWIPIYDCGHDVYEWRV